MLQVKEQDIFRFKQFQVDQTGCAMKINTDGVLLAAMLQATAPKTVLDIGTGTGVIALMLAQRFEHARIHAIEIDAAAAHTAEGNFRRSPFSERLSASHVAIEEFSAPLKFDLVVSNPPYFINDLKSTERKKGIARHTSPQFFSDLAAKVAGLLSPEGLFWFILPVKQAALLIKEAATQQLTVHKFIDLHSDVTKPAFRNIVCLGKHQVEPAHTHFYIYESEKVYTQAYVNVLKDFFLRLG